MSRRWIVRPLAESDIAQAASWYERHRAGLGLRFLDATDRLFDRLRISPLQFPLVSTDMRRALLHTFPYAVYFRVTDDAVVIFAVLHMRRDPRTWQMDRTFPRGTDVKFAKLYTAVVRAINAADPIGLLASGAPDDEYSSEISTVVPRLTKAQSVQECRDILHEEFVRWFSADTAGPPDAYAKLAVELWPAVQEFLATGGRRDS
jgi:plasmid stabilization system protein ParE